MANVHWYIYSYINHMMKKKSQNSYHFLEEIDGQI